MSKDERLTSDQFPRASAYHPEWVLGGAGGGANPLWLTEWLCEALPLKSDMRILDLGCGRALSSIFLHREFGAQVWATDLWYGATENIQRIRDAGCDNSVFPMRADARSLPFSEGFFDAIVAIDSFMFYGTDDLYLNYLARFLKPGGLVAIAQAGFQDELGESVPAHLREWWMAEMPYCLHSADWWRHHWQRSGIVDVSLADTMPNGWHYWRDWMQLIAPGNKTELDALEADAGQHFGYVRVVGQRRSGVPLIDFNMSFPPEYTQHPLLRDSSPS